MAIIRKNLPSMEDGNWTKVDNDIFWNRNLSEGAKLLYCFLASLRNAHDFNEEYAMNALKLSDKTLRSRKKELTDAGLILLDRVGKFKYFLYIGHSGFKASEVKRYWDRIDNFGKDVSLKECQDGK